MPDDLSGWGYCSTCEAIHERDVDGYVCSDTRPLPKATIAPGIRRPVGRLRRALQRLLAWFIDGDRSL